MRWVARLVMGVVTLSASFYKIFDMAKKKDKTFAIKTVIKSTGKRQVFSWKKIKNSIFLAGRDTKEFNKKQTREILQKVKTKIKKIKKKVVSTREIREIVEPAIAGAGYFETARYYILFQERKKQKKKKFKTWEPNMVKNAKIALLRRCSKQGNNGEYTETPGEIFWRTARHMAKAEVNWGNEHDVEHFSEVVFEKLASFKFICTTSAMYEAGNEDCTGQLSPCFVLPIEDSIPSIFKILGEAALIQKNYGGTGFNFSRVRMKGDKVRNVPNAASGPVDFLQAYSAALSKIMQGSKKHGGNMGILNIDHPDIFDFIKIKDEDGNIKNFNISVGVTNKFMEAVLADKRFDLVNPRNRKKIKAVKARRLFDKICEHAWLTGDPGMIFLDRMEEDNPTPSLGVLDATNPCGEQPLLPYESCNLSSIHLGNHVITTDQKPAIDWDDLKETVHTIVRFLDNMIETNYYVLPETEKMVKYGNRKIGVGMIGFGEVLFKLGVGYNSKEAVRIADKIAKFVKRQAEEASLELAKTRGVFPNWESSMYRGSSEKYRNCTMITIAPTGTVSMIGDTTNSVEPYFALVYTRRSFYNEDHKNRSTKVLHYVVSEFEQVLKKRGLYSKKLILKVAKNYGSVQGMKEVPRDIQRTFVTTHDIAPEWHVRIQAAFQKYADNAVSKTINFANSASVKDVKDAYMLAWKLGCKGITIYRDGSKDDQVLNVDSNVKSKNNDVAKQKCPECSGDIIYESGCEICRDCGWSKCKT